MSDVKNHSTLPTNLVSYWELEEASGTRVDSHGSNDLTDNNTVGQGTGKQGNCADFEKNQSEFLEITDASQSGLDITGDLSIAAWIQLESLSNSTLNAIVTKDDGASQRSYIFCVWDSEDPAGTFNLMLWAHSTSSSTIFNKNWSPSTGTWYHVACVYDASAGSCEFFVDGSSIGSEGSGVNSLKNSTGDFHIGAGNTQYHWDGLIDEVGIWDKTLTSSEITDLYNSGSGLPYDAGSSGPANVKTIDTIAIASVKTIDTIAIASVKTRDTVV